MRSRCPNFLAMFAAGVFPLGAFIDFAMTKRPDMEHVANSPACEAMLSAPKPQVMTLREVTPLLTSSKWEQIVAMNKRQAHQFEINAAMSARPSAALAGPRWIEVRHGQAFDDVQIYVQARGESGRSFVIRDSEVLDHVEAGSATGRYVLVENATSTRVHLIDLDRGKVVLRLRHRGRGTDEPIYASFSADGKQLNVRYYGAAEVYDLSGSEPSRRAWFTLNHIEDDERRYLRGQVHFTPDDNLVLHYHDHPLRQVKPGGLAVAGRPGRLGHEKVLRGALPYGQAWSGVTDAAYKYLYVVRGLKEIDVFDLNQQTLFKTLFAPFAIDRLAVSPDGQYVAVSSFEASAVGVFMLDYRYPTLTHKLESSRGEIDLLSFSGNRELRMGNAGLAEVYGLELP